MLIGPNTNWGSGGRQLVEYYVEKTYEERVTGNIYKGKLPMLPGMQRHL